MSDLRVLQVRPDRFANWQDDLRTFEERFEYPLGDDHFHIDHGEDYLAFFRRLGEPAPFLATVARRVVGVLVAVRRRVGRREGWYLCDLKVDPVYARYRAATRLLTSWARAHLQDGEPVFGVSMNPARGDNRLVRAMRRWRADELSHAPIVLYSLSHEQWLDRADEITAALGPIGWFDPHGVKDIVLRSSGAPMPLLHAQHGPFARANAEARAGAVHMFCLPADDVLVERMRQRGLRPDATATIVHRDADGANWRHLLSSDI
ncbi:MAG: hypothetical protein ACE37K_14910 [Planctomycetota bacterium]